MQRNSIFESGGGANAEGGGRSRIVSRWWRALGILLSGLFCTGQAASQEVVYADPGGAESLAAYHASVIWSSDDCAGVAFEVCLIRNGFVTTETVPVFAGVTFDNGGGDPDDSVASNLDHARGYVYWLSRGGEVLRKYRDAMGPPTVISTMATPVILGEIAADDTHVYWVENVAGQGTIYRAPIDGGPREFVMGSPDGPATQLHVDHAGRVYFVADIAAVFCCEAAIHQVTPDGAGGFTRRIAARSFVSGFTVDENEIFAAHRLTPGGDLLVSSAPTLQIDDGSFWVDHYNAGSSGPPEIVHLALSDDDVFFHEERPTTSSSILRLARTGGMPAAITLPVAEAKDLLVSGDSRNTWIAWLEAGVIYRSSATGGPIARDLDADDIDLEVVQVVQDSAHSVPLSENKRTHVRAFARLAAASDGATTLDLFPSVSLAGTRGGVPLRDSPLRPLERRQPIGDDPVARESETNDFVFELPESWTSGTVVLTATVDPSDIVFETDETNNATSRSVTFMPVGGICMDIIPVDTTLGVEAGGSLSARSSTFARARTMLPTDDLVWLKRGGTPKRKPWSGDVYNFMEEDDAQELMFNWFFDFNTSGTPSQCSGRRTIRTAAVSGAARFGISSGAASLIMYLQAMGGSPEENVPVGGTSGLAHEVGHQLGQGHIGCPLPGMTGAPGNPDGAYPYGPCTLEDSNEHLGFDPITKKIITPYDPASGFPVYTDFMSYGGPYWASDWVYRRHHAELAGSTPSPPVGGGGTFVVGGFQRDDGSVELGYGYDLDPLTAAASALKIGANSVVSSDLALRIFDTNDILQVEEPLRVSDSVEESEGDPTWTAFIALVEYQPDYGRVEVIDALGSVLATREPGGAPPSVVITSPSSGAVLGDTVIVDWTGSDPDAGDVLEYRLDYSPDGGATWLDVAWTRTTTASIDMTSMPTGANALFRVLVSDGVHGSEDSVGPFAIANRAPEVAILTDEFQEPSGPLVWTYGGHQALRGYGYDSDDGPLSGTSLSWNVTGSTSTTNTGDRVFFDLTPGDYQVDLVATDGFGLASSTSVPLTVLPRAVPDVTAATEPPNFDGRCQDPAYGEDDARMPLRYASGEKAEVAGARTDGFVYFCFAGLPLHQGAEFVELRLDPDASADALMQASDRFIRVYRDGGIESGVGDGLGGDFIDSVAVDVLAATTVSEIAWQAEIRINETMMDPTGGLGALHGFDVSDRAAWPEKLVETSPETWGQVLFLPEPGFGWSVLVGALGVLASRRARP